MNVLDKIKAESQCDKANRGRCARWWFSFPVSIGIVCERFHSISS